MLHSTRLQIIVLHPTTGCPILNLTRGAKILNREMMGRKQLLA